ncbi:MAG: nucleotide exchange factor GrpE, partial [Candidatus Eisenbacteria bacterium]
KGPRKRAKSEETGEKPAAPAEESASSPGAASQEAGELPAGEEEALRGRVEELTDKWLRAAADLDNYKKRTARERERDLWLARAGVAHPLLEVLDDLERALAEENADPDAFRRGVALIRQKFLAALSSVGVEPFPSVGQPFDPGKHEALHRIPSADVAEGHVAAEIRRGYRSGERVLRPALVAVAGPAEEAEEPDDDDDE